MDAYFQQCIRQSINPLAKLPVGQLLILKNHRQMIMPVSKVLERKDVPQESKWNKEAVFASWDEWGSDF